MQIELKVKATDKVEFRQESTNRDPMEFTELEIIGSPRVLMPTPQFLEKNPLYLPEFTLLLQISHSGSVYAQIIPKEAETPEERRSAIEASSERRKKREVARITHETEALLKTQEKLEKDAEEVARKARESGGIVPEDRLHEPGLDWRERARIDTQNRSAAGIGGTLGNQSPGVGGSGLEQQLRDVPPLSTPGQAAGDSGDKEPGREHVKEPTPAERGSAPRPTEVKNTGAPVAPGTPATPVDKK